MDAFYKNRLSKVDDPFKGYVNLRNQILKIVPMQLNEVNYYEHSSGRLTSKGQMEEQMTGTFDYTEFVICCHGNIWVCIRAVDTKY